MALNAMFNKKVNLNGIWYSTGKSRGGFIEF